MRLRCAWLAKMPAIEQNLKGELESMRLELVNSRTQKLKLTAPLRWIGDKVSPELNTISNSKL